MTIKRGDLVRYVGKVQANYGRFARAIRQESMWDTGEAAWVTDPSFFMPDGAMAYRTVARLLRPLRADGITDSEVSELFSPSPAKESEKV